MHKGFTLAVLILSALPVSTAFAQGRQAGQLDYTIGAAYSYDETVNGRFGSTLDLKSYTGLQIGLDYFVSNKVSLGFDMTWLNPRYSATLVPDDGSPEVDIDFRGRVFTGQFNGAYNFIDGPFTPYVEAGLGWTYFDSNISRGSPVVGCWWDPWWGYICSDFYSSYNSTSFSYGVGAGVRMDLQRNLFVKAGYRRLEAEFSNVPDNPVLEQISLEMGWRF